MPDIPVYNFRRDFNYKPSKFEKNLAKKKPLGYRKYSTNGIKPKTSTLPHPFKCSKCEYIGIDNKTVQSHYFDTH